MASYFGEVMPLSSRAVDDEEVDNQPKYAISIEKLEQSTPYKTKFMIFSVGEIASIFVKSHFLQNDSEKICSIMFSCEKDDDDESTFYTGMQHNKNRKNVIAASLFTSSADVLICDVSKSVPEELCYEVTQLILKNYLPSVAIILTTKHMATFKRGNALQLEMSFLKSISTSEYNKSYSCNIPPLPPPNFLTNMPASILLHCEITKLPALCVVNYVDTNAVDYLNVHIFDEILKEPIVSKISRNGDAKEKIIKLVKGSQSVESNLYM